MAPLTCITEWCPSEVTLPGQQVTNLRYYYCTTRALERIVGAAPTSSGWKPDIIAVILYPLDY